MTAALYGYTDVGEQAWMILDHARTSAYAEAIRETVRDGDVVLDIGSGSGVLALLAAKAGARKVFAVEQSAAADLARRNVERNGLGDVVEVLRGDLLSIEALDELADVVQGEMLGNFATDEHMHRLYGHARRLAKPDARWIPSRYRLLWGAVRADRLAEERRRLLDVSGVDLSATADLLAQRVSMAHVEPSELMGDEVSGGDHSVLDPLPSRHSAKLTIARGGELGAIAVGFEAQLSPSVVLRTGVADARTHWRQTVFPLEPSLPVAEGDEVELAVRPRLITDRGTWAWSAQVGDEVRVGDAMRALLGSKDDLLDALRLTTGADEVSITRLLEAFAGACGGTPPTSVEEAVARLRASQPDRYTDDEDARQDVWPLFRAAGALKLSGGKGEAV